MNSEKNQNIILIGMPGSGTSTLGVLLAKDLGRRFLLSVDVEHAVIATGGSVVYSQAGMEALKRNGTVVYLAATYEEVEKRVTNITTRGIVRKHGCSLQDAFEERVPLYEQYSDYTVDGTGKSIEACVEEIVRLFR